MREWQRRQQQPPLSLLTLLLLLLIVLCKAIDDHDDNVPPSKAHLNSPSQHSPRFNQRQYLKRGNGPSSSSSSSSSSDSTSSSSSSSSSFSLLSSTDHVYQNNLFNQRTLVQLSVPAPNPTPFAFGSSLSWAHQTFQFYIPLGGGVHSVYVWDCFCGGDHFDVYLNGGQLVFGTSNNCSPVNTVACTPYNADPTACFQQAGFCWGTYSFTAAGYYNMTIRVRESYYRAERKAVNKYYPPDWDPSKGSINRHLGQHPLRERARKLSEGILIIRFELPFNIWCLSCDRHLARGVRFNAEKRTVGRYLSTSIYAFRMKCPSCGGWFEIHTDPARSEYQVISGARRKTEEWTAESAGLPPPSLTDAQREELSVNPFLRLEHQSRDRKQMALAVPRLQERIRRSEALWRDDFGSSSAVRSRFRQEKAVIADRRHKETAMKERLCLGDLAVSAERPEDVEAARRVQFGQTNHQLPPVSNDIFNRTTTTTTSNTRHSSRLAAKLAAIKHDSSSLLSDLELGVGAGSRGKDAKISRKR